MVNRIKPGAGRIFFAIVMAVCAIGLFSTSAKPSAAWLQASALLCFAWAEFFEQPKVPMSATVGEVYHDIRRGRWRTTPAGRCGGLVLCCFSLVSGCNGLTRGELGSSARPC